jgi:hypothetical protein
VLVAENEGVIPGMATFEESFSTMVTIEAALPFAVTELVPVMLEKAANAEPAANTTLPPVMLIGDEIASTLLSGVSDASVQVEIPDAFEEEHAP